MALTLDDIISENELHLRLITGEDVSRRLNVSELLDVLDLYLKLDSLCDPAVAASCVSNVAVGGIERKGYLGLKLFSIQEHLETQELTTVLDQAFSHIRGLNRYREFPLVDEQKKRIAEISNELLLTFPGLGFLRDNLIFYLNNSSPWNRFHDIDHHIFLHKRFYNKDESVSNYSGMKISEYAATVSKLFRECECSNLNSFVLAFNYNLNNYLEIRSLMGDQNIYFLAKDADRHLMSHLRGLDQELPGLGSEEEKIEHMNEKADELKTSLKVIRDIGRKMKLRALKAPPDVYNLIFNDNNKYNFESVESFYRSVEDCADCIKNLQERGNWKLVKPIIESFTSFEHILAGSKKILGMEPLREEDMGVDISRFLSQSAHDGMRPEQIPEAIGWYKSIGRHIEQEERTEYFKIVDRYHYEYNIMQFQWMAVGQLPTVGLNARLDYILGPDCAMMSTKQKEAILRNRNALKMDVDENTYKHIIGQLISIKSLSQILPEYELARLRQFKDTYGLENLPIRERRVSVVSKNKTYVVDIILPGDQVLTTFLKVYDDESDCSAETQLLNRLADKKLNLPLAISSTAAKIDGGPKTIQMFSFLNGINLYSHLNDIKRKNTGDYLTKAVDGLVEVQKNCSNLIPLKELTPEHAFFETYLFEHMRIGNIDEIIITDIRRNTNSLIGYIIDQTGSQEHPCYGAYFKDSNPRNVMLSKSKGDKKDIVSHIDFEYTDFALREIDLAKLLRNGLEYQDWDDSKDLGMDLPDDLRQKSRRESKEYLRSKRYLDEKDEEVLVQRFNGAWKSSYNKEDRKRYDMASLYVHLYYIGWFSMKGVQAANEETARIVGNRKKYHLLEAKCLIGDIMVKYNNDLDDDFKRELPVLGLALDRIR